MSGLGAAMSAAVKQQLDDYKPKWCRTKLCRLPFGHEDPCAAPVPKMVQAMPPSSRRSRRGHGVGIKRNRNPKALPWDPFADRTPHRVTQGPRHKREAL